MEKKNFSYAWGLPQASLRLAGQHSVHLGTTPRAPATYLRHASRWLSLQATADNLNTGASAKDGTKQ
jgi:hypothetical protein